MNSRNRVFIAMLSQFIEKLSRNLEFEQPLSPNDDGSYSLDLEPNLHITLRENPESGITLFAVLAPFSEHEREEFLVKAMTANLFGRETGGSALGLDRDGKNVTLLFFVPKESTYHDFHDSIEDFVNYAEAWRQETMEKMK